MNGEHEVRLERIEESLRGLHEKVDGIAEAGVVNRADIRWLKWAVRGVLLAAVGGGAILSLPGFI